MTRTVTAVAARPVSYGMFDDLPGVPPVESFTSRGPETVVTFAAPLTDGQAAAVRDRLTSRDDAQQAERASLRATLATLQTGLDGAPVTESPLVTLVAAAVLELGRYELGAPT